MDKLTVTIPYEEFKKMAEMAGKVEALRAFTLASKYSIDRETIAKTIGFDLPEKE